MRQYLLDTTPLAALLNNRAVAVATLRRWLEAGELATSILVYGEVLESLARYAKFCGGRRAALTAARSPASIAATGIRRPGKTLLSITPSVSGWSGTYAPSCRLSHMIAIPCDLA